MSNQTLRTIAAFGAAVTLTLTACGGDDDDATSDPPPAAADDGDVADGDAAAISIADFAFDGVGEVAVGTTVVVTNTDSAQHTWSALDDSFDSGALAPGDSFEFTFTDPGTYEYRCNFHPSMTGTIVVTG